MRIPLIPISCPATFPSELNTPGPPVEPPGQARGTAFDPSIFRRNPERVAPAMAGGPSRGVAKPGLTGSNAGLPFATPGVKQ